MTEDAIIQSALQRLSIAERSEYLDTACKGDADLRARVERRLADGDALTLPLIITNDDQNPILATTLKSTLHSNMVAGSGGVEPHSVRIGAGQSTEPAMRLGDYELQEILGRGGMGVVTKGLDCKLRRIVAIKTLSEVFSHHPQARARFLREAQAAAAVRHDNVVTIYSVDERAEFPFLVMEFIDGRSLQQRIEESGPLPIVDIVRIGMQIAAGLAAAHRIGLVHRDIKPANILLERDTERVKITDFGLARAISDVGLTQEGQVAGTPQFMSPEQALGLAVDHRSDLFSLGSVMYSMCTAASAFQANSVVVVLRRVCDDQPAPIGDLRFDVPKWLCAVIEKLMSKRAEDRFQTASEVENLLRAKLETPVADRLVSTTIEPTTTIEPLPKRLARSHQGTRRAVAVIAGLVLLFIGVCMINWPPKSSQKNDAPETTAAATSNSLSPRTKSAPPPGPLLSKDDEWTDPVNLGPHINTAEIEEHPTLANNGLTLLFVRSGKLMQSRRTDISGSFGDAVMLGGPVNDEGVVQGPFVSEDGLNLWFASSRAGSLGKNDLWSSRRASMDEPFSAPVNLGSGINTDQEESTPWVSADGLTLLFCSFRPGTRNVDIFRATRTSIDSSFDHPEPLDRHGGNLVNVEGNQFYPRLTADECAMLFTMTDHKGQYFRLTTRATKDAQFESPIDLPPKINQNVVAAAAISNDGSVLIFDSNRTGGNGSFDLWESRRVRKGTELPSVAAQSLNAGFALQFDGQTSFVKVPDLSRDDSKPYTLEGWIRPELQHRSQVVMLVSGKSMMQIGKSEDHLFPVALETQFTNPAENPKFVSGEWIHVALVYGDRNLRFFVNGACRLQIPLQESPARLPHAFDGFWIGAHPVQGEESQIQYFFRGQMDEIRVSSKARYDRGFRPQVRFETDADTLALFHCDEGNGTELKDSSGNNRHGRMIGVKWVGSDEKTKSIGASSFNAQDRQQVWSKRLNVPVEDTNAIGMKLMLVPPGDFLMGAQIDDAEAAPHERPQHRVTLTKPFFMGATEVTVAEFRQFVQATNYVTEAESDMQGVFGVPSKERRPEYIWTGRNLARPNDESVPVTCVSWEDARQFCEWLTQKESAVYRLPTDAEWEFACRAGTSTRFSFGNDFDGRLANAARDMATNEVLPVAQFPPNPFGLFDMHGNVNELCLDMGRTYTSEAMTDPVGVQGDTVVVRGGAATSHSSRLRSSHRYLTDRRQHPEQNFATIVKGFRVVREIPRKDQ